MLKQKRGHCSLPRIKQAPSLERGIIELDSAAVRHQLINSKQYKVIFPASVMTRWRLEKQGKLPPPVRIGGRNYWRLQEVAEALERLRLSGSAHPAARDDSNG
jgi:predicted DNA-binding transcriptional regulator AlpA